MNGTRNPFGPWGDAKAYPFYGQHRAVITTFGHLKQNRSCMVLGERRIGKSSFLQYISQPGISDLYGLINVWMVTFPWDKLIEPETPVEVREFYRIIVGHIHREASKAGYSSIVNTLVNPATGNVKNIGNFAQLKTLIEDIYCKKQLVLLFDEAEYLCHHFGALGQPYRDSFFGNLRAFLAEFPCVITSRKPLPEFEMPGEAIPTVHLGLLSDVDSTRLIREPIGWVLPNSGTQDRDIELIRECAGNHPFLITYICYYFFEKYLQPSSPKPFSGLRGKERERELTGFLTGMSEDEVIVSVFDEAWAKYLEPREREILKALDSPGDITRKRWASLRPFIDSHPAIRRIGEGSAESLCTPQQIGVHLGLQFTRELRPEYNSAGDRYLVEGLATKGYIVEKDGRYKLFCEPFARFVRRKQLPQRANEPRRSEIRRWLLSGIAALFINLVAAFIWHLVEPKVTTETFPWANILTWPPSLHSLIGVIGITLVLTTLLWWFVFKE